MEKQEFFEKIAPYLPYNVLTQYRLGDVVDNAPNLNEIRYKTFMPENAEFVLKFCKPILIPLSDLEKSSAKDLMSKFNCSFDTIQEVWRLSQDAIKLEDIKYSTYLMFCKNHIDFNNLIKNNLAIDINTIK